MATSKSVYTAAPVGATIVLPDASRTASFALISVKGRADTLGEFKTHKAIVTTWHLEENVNAQFTHTMGNDIYVNVFGNRMGILTVRGITFHSVSSVGEKGCDDVRAADPDKPMKHGINHIIQWYQDNRVSNPDSPERINITIGKDTAVEGFLVGASYSARDPVNWTVEYTMQIAVIPK